LLTDLAGNLSDLHDVLAAAQLCPQSEAASAALLQCYCPPSSFVQAAVHFLASCCMEAAALRSSENGGNNDGSSVKESSSTQKQPAMVAGLGPPHTLVSCAAILSDWLEVLQPTSPTSSQPTTALGDFSLNCSSTSGLSLLLKQGPSIAPVLRGALGQMSVLARKREGNGAGSVQWHQALWMAHVLATLDSSQQPDSSIGNVSESSSSSDEGEQHLATPLLSFSSWDQWDLLQPSTLATCFQCSSSEVAAAALTRLALVRKGFNIAEGCSVDYVCLSGNVSL
jgi:hypothetical protein